MQLTMGILLIMFGIAGLSLSIAGEILVTSPIRFIDAMELSTIMIVFSGLNVMAGVYMLYLNFES